MDALPCIKAQAVPHPLVGLVPGTHQVTLQDPMCLTRTRRRDPQSLTVSDRVAEGNLPESTTPFSKRRQPWPILAAHDAVDSVPV